MNKTKLFLVVGLVCALTLSWCKCNCTQDELSDRAQYCLDNLWTYSHVISQDEEYWECQFPSGVTCRDDILTTEQCNFEPNLDDIDTEEERLAGCEKNAQEWMIDFEEWSENIVVDWWNESEWWASFVRNWVVKYVKNGKNWTIDAQCVADFVDGSLSVSFGEAVAWELVVQEVEEEISGETLDDTIEWIVIEEISGENIEIGVEPVESEEIIEEVVVE